MAGNSIAAWNLLTLGRCSTARLPRAARGARSTTSRGASGDGAAGMPQMLVAMDLERSTTRHVVIAGRAEAADARAMVAEFDRRSCRTMRCCSRAGEARSGSRARAVRRAARAAEREGHGLRVRGLRLPLPTTDLAAFAAQLEERGEKPATGRILKRCSRLLPAALRWRSRRRARPARRRRRRRQAGR
jgi:hypothetical protein